MGEFGPCLISFSNASEMLVRNTMIDLKRGVLLIACLLIASLLIWQGLPERLSLNLTTVSWLHLISEEPPAANPYHVTSSYNAYQCHEPKVASIHQAFKEAAADHLTTWSVRHVAESLAWCGQFMAAIEALERDLPSCQDDLLARLLVGGLSFKLQKRDKAIAAWDCPRLQLHLLEAGKGLLNQGRADEARELYQILIEIEDANATAYFGLGNTYRYQGRWGEAHDAYQQAAELMPKNGEIVANYAVAIFKTNGNPEEAKALIEQAIVLQPGNVWLYSHLSDYHTSRGEHEEAEAALLHAVTLFPERHVPSLLLGYVYMGWGKPELAVVSLQKAEQIGDYSGQTADALGSAYRQVGELEMGLTYHRQATQQAPHKIQYGFNLARAYAEVGQCQAAQQEVARVEKLSNYEESAWATKKQQINSICDPAS